MYHVLSKVRPYSRNTGRPASAGRPVFHFSLSKASLNKNIVSALSFDLTQSFCFSSKSSPIPERILRSVALSNKSQDQDASRPGLATLSHRTRR